MFDQYRRGFKNNNKYILCIHIIIRLLYYTVVLHTSHVKVHIIIYYIDTREVYSLNTLNDVQIVYDPSINVCRFELFEVSVLHIILYYYYYCLDYCRE